MVYVDSDGVLANFKEWIDLFRADSINKDVLRIIVENYKECYICFNQIPHSEFLFDSIRLNDDWYVLTVVPNTEKIRKKFPTLDSEKIYKTLVANKINWFTSRNIKKEKIIIAWDAEDKLSYCRKGDILYDDYYKNVSLWEKSGGIGIHVKNSK